MIRKLLIRLHKYFIHKQREIEHEETPVVAKWTASITGRSSHNAGLQRREQSGTVVSQSEHETSLTASLVAIANSLLAHPDMLDECYIQEELVVVIKVDRSQQALNDEREPDDYDDEDNTKEEWQKV